MRRTLGALLGGLALVACGPSDPTSPIADDCPGAPIPIVVSVDQWGDIVERVAGPCGEVTTVIDGSTGDPHSFEPSPADLAAFDEAELVVRNGLGYDTWAVKAVDALGQEPVVVDAGDVAGRPKATTPTSGTTLVSCGRWPTPWPTSWWRCVQVPPPTSPPAGPGSSRRWGAYEAEVAAVHGVANGRSSAPPSPYSI